MGKEEQSSVIYKVGATRNMLQYPETVAFEFSQSLNV